MWWRRALAIYAILPAGATFYFFVFWHWFDYWKKHRLRTYALMAATFGVLAVALVLGRDWVLAGRVDAPSPVKALGWILIAQATVLGTIADRQIGLRVRTFTPFFADTGHIKLQTKGVYGVVRHPIYAAGLWVQVGVLLVTGYPALLIAAVIFGVGALWFTKQEEQRLIPLLQDPSEYEHYRERVPALLPRLRR